MSANPVNFDCDIITIDGPAASGKSTVAELLANELQYLYFDTGVMYRALTWVVLRNNVNVEDESSVSKLAQQVKIDVREASVNDGRKCDVWINGVDVSWKIRTPEVESNVSIISSYGKVREELVNQQRRIGQRGRVVMVGRDIGTVVMPSAKIKIFLEASVEVRAKRRFAELHARDKSLSYDSILESMRRRDQLDSSRAISPLKPALGAYIINTDGKSVQDVMREIYHLLQTK